jgi:hypothetical protein
MNGAKAVPPLNLNRLSGGRIAALLRGLQMEGKCSTTIAFVSVQCRFDGTGDKQPTMTKLCTGSQTVDRY